MNNGSHVHGPILRILFLLCRFFGQIIFYVRFQVCDQVFCNPLVGVLADALWED